MKEKLTEKPDQNDTNNLGNGSFLPKVNLNNMRWNCFILLFLIKCFTLNAQERICNKVNDSLYYIEIDIRKSDSYPIIMSGVCKSLDFDLYINENEELFVGSFYKHCFYVPDIQSDNMEIISDHLCPTEKEKYVANYKNIAFEMIRNINRNSIQKTIKLVNKSIVFLSVCKVKGLFLVVDKANNIFINSNELDINNIPEIQKIYIPLNISCYEKPVFSVK